MPPPPAERAKGTSPLGGLQRLRAFLVSPENSQNPGKDLEKIPEGVKITRREFLRGGVLGVAALALDRVFPSTQSKRGLSSRRVVEEENSIIQEIFAALKEPLEEVLAHPCELSGFSLFIDPQTGEVRGILANATTDLSREPSQRSYIASIAVRRNDGGNDDGKFTRFRPLRIFNPETDRRKTIVPTSIIKHPNGSISIGGWKYWGGGIPHWFTSYDNGRTWVDESGKIPVPQAEMSNPHLLIDDDNNDFFTIIYAANYPGGPLLVRYSDGTMKQITWQPDGLYTGPVMSVSRRGNRVVGYIESEGVIKEFTVSNIYNPQADTRQIPARGLGGYPDAFDVKWGVDRAEKIYVAVTGPNVFQILDSSGNVLSETPYSQLGLGSIGSVRLIGENRLLIGGVENNEPVLALLDLNSNIRRKKRIMPAGIVAGINSQPSMQVGEIDGKIYAFMFVQKGGGDGYGLAAQEINPENMEFIGEHLWIVNGLGEPYKNHLPLVMSNFRQSGVSVKPNENREFEFEVNKRR